MKQVSTLFLRGVVWTIGLIALALCVFGLPAVISHNNVGEYSPVLAGMYLSAVPFFVALYQTLKLLSYIDKNNVFSALSIKALGYIKYCAVIISALYVAGMPLIFRAADKDDAPGVIVIGLVIIGASVTIATFAAVLQKLLQNAVDIKTEHDLTV